VKSRYKEAIKEAQTIPEGSLNKEIRKTTFKKMIIFLKVVLLCILIIIEGLG
jgi:hypothetical protein